MPHERYSAVGRLVVAHLVLAVAPSMMGLVPLNERWLPILLSLATIPIAQATLASIAMGMASNSAPVVRVTLLLTGGLYLAVWSALGQTLISEDPSPRGFFQACLENGVVFSGFLCTMTVFMIGASRLIGTIQVVTETDPPLSKPEYRFSLLMLFGLSTVTAIVLGLVRMARMQPDSTYTTTLTIEYVLTTIAFALNTFLIVWGTLGPGHVIRRLAIVFCVSFLLGLSLATASNSLSEAAAWSLAVVAPTVIVVLSLLYLRRNGFRLVAPTKQSPLPPQMA